VGRDRLVLDEVIQHVRLVVVSPDAQPPLVETQGVIGLDPEVIIQQFVQLIEGFRAGQPVLPDGLEDRVESIRPAAELGIEKRLRILMAPDTLEPPEHRPRHVDDEFAEWRVHAGALHEIHDRRIDGRADRIRDYGRARRTW
jgi:hypothetical protein